MRYQHCKWLNTGMPTGSMTRIQLSDKQGCSVGTTSRPNLGTICYLVGQFCGPFMEVITNHAVPKFSRVYCCIPVLTNSEKTM